MRSLLRCTTFVVTLIGSATFIQNAAADDAEAGDAAAAKVLFERGIEKMDAKQYAAGCPLVAESLRINPKPGTLFTLATCEFEWGHSASAAVRYEEYLLLYDELPADAKKKQGTRPAYAKEKLEALASEVPHWTIKLPPNAPPGTVIRRDGVLLGEEMLGKELPVDPGDYLFSTQAPGGEVWEKSFKLEKGDKKTIELKVKVPPPPPPPPRPIVVVPQVQKVTVKPTSSEGRTASYVTLGIGGAVLLLGGITGGVAIGKKDTADSHCGVRIGRADDETVCDEVGLDAGQSAKSLATVSNVGFVLGAFGAGVGILLLALPDSSSPPPKGKTASITHVGLLSASPTNALFGATGTF